MAYAHHLAYLSHCECDWVASTLPPVFGHSWAGGSASTWQALQQATMRVSMRCWLHAAASVAPATPATSSTIAKISKTAAAAANSPSLQKLVSSVDSSVNYIRSFGRSTLESRYVRRAPESISVYVSSHNGCKMKCKFCWLTAQGQTEFQHVGIDQYVQQLRTVLQDAPNPSERAESRSLSQGSDEKRVLGSNIPRSRVRINVNFMSRGEALANKHVVNSYDKLYMALESAVRECGFASVKMNVSSIMPYTIRNRRLSEIFRYQPVSIFYSLYSMSPAFRSAWLPNAIPPLEALGQLKQLQLDYEKHFRQLAVLQSGGPPAIPVVPQVHFHWAFIEGQNDTEADVLEMVREIRSHNFTQSKFNLVRFNPHPTLPYREPDAAQLEKLFSLIQSSMNDDALDARMHKSRIIPRAGPDVFASCGMFQKDSEEGVEAVAI